jgi:hypothetical protein
MVTAGEILSRDGMEITLVYPDGTERNFPGLLYPAGSMTSPYTMTKLGEAHRGAYICILPAEAVITDEHRTWLKSPMGDFNVVSAERIFALGRWDHWEAVLVRRAGEGT